MRHESALPLIAPALGSALQLPVERRADVTGCDLILAAGDRVFAVEYVVDASAEFVGAGLRSLAACVQATPGALPLLVMPYARPTARMLCESAGVSWLDLSGNAGIVGPGLLVRIEGRPDAHRRRGRPRDIFSPGITRVAMAFLLSPERAFTQTELAEETLMNRGTVSRHVRRLAQAGFVTTGGRGRGACWRVEDPDLMLNAWRAAYDFERHDIRRGHIPALAGPNLLGHIAEVVERHELPYAATGLAAAWLIAPFATYRLVTVYLPAWLPAKLLDELGFVAEPRGANTWLVHASDEGVFMGTEVADGIRHVNSVQAYLDLKAQPERSAEAAEELSRRGLPWRRHE